MELVTRKGMETNQYFTQMLNSKWMILSILAQWYTIYFEYCVVIIITMHTYT